MKKIKVLALIMVFAFAALGGAYAMWNDTLVIAETVNTGVLDLKWSDAFCVDPSPNYTGYEGNVYGTDQNRDGLDTMDVGNPNDNKNIGSLDAKIEAYGSNDKISNDDKLTITLENGYPGYQEAVFATINNVGTVPTKFEVTQSCIPCWLDVKILEPTFGSITEPTPPLEAFQIDPGQSRRVMILTRVLESAPQQANRSFTLTLNAVQWNGYDFDTMPNQITLPRQDNFPYPADNV